MSQVHNFSAGPAILPKDAIERSIQALRNFRNTGLSLVEVSHRSPEFDAVMQEAQDLVRFLFHVPDDYSVLFLQGGASTQFAMIPYNLLPEGGKAAYLNTGSWSKKAIKEAKMFGDVEVVASSEDKNFTYIPKDYQIPSDAAYFHITTNNTIFGTQIKNIPDSPVPLVADMSSDIFSRPIDISKFGLIYAGAQKNMGPAGTTLVIIKNSLLEKSGRQIPSMLNYKTHTDKNSMYNTPPVFAIYLSMEVLKWVKENGGTEIMNERNREKADLLYNEIDRNKLFTGTAAKEDRSDMNVTFVMTTEGLDEAFLKAAKEANISGIKGHRSVGGFRASIYNAMPKESIEALIKLMQDFERNNG
jgi:phosphoserine aminotransferase